MDFEEAEESEPTLALDLMEDDIKEEWHCPTLLIFTMLTV